MSDDKPSPPGTTRPHNFQVIPGNFWTISGGICKHCGLRVKSVYLDDTEEMRVERQRRKAVLAAPERGDELDAYMLSVGYKYDDDASSYLPVGDYWRTSQRWIGRDQAAVFLAHQQVAVDEAVAAAKRLHDASDKMHEARRGVDDYAEFKGSDDPLERTAAWINQLSPWNLRSGVEHLRHMEQAAVRAGQVAILQSFEPLQRDHSKCIDARSCIGYQNAASDFDNEKERLIGRLEQEGEQR